MSKNTWALRFKSPQDLPNIAKFNDEVNWDQGVLPISAYFKEEELKEDDMPVAEDSLYFRRKRERRRYYRSKKSLVLEDATASAPAESHSGFRFEGKLCNLGLADTEDAKTKAQSTNTEPPFRYVMLQFVKGKNSNGEASNEINVIPVGDMFALKKTVQVDDELLADIDSRFMDELQRSKGHISRYKGINKSLTSAERARVGLRTEDDTNNGGTEGLNSKEFLGGYGSSNVFGAAINKVISSKVGGGRRDSTGASATRGLLNENGIDEDELRAEGYQNGDDYAVKFADDEEEYVTTEQVYPFCSCCPNPNPNPNPFHEFQYIS